MSKPYLRSAISVTLAIASVAGVASPASANHTSGFAKNEYRVGESDGYVELSVGGDPCCPPGSGQFDYYTANLTAIAGTDYEQTSGTATFAACLPCTIRVPIMGDELFESEEQFEVRLTNFKGTLQPEDPQRRRAVVRIIDDDPKPASPSATAGRSSQQTSAASSGALSKPSSQPSGPSGAGDPKESVHSMSVDSAFEEGAVGADETDSQQNSDHPRLATPPGRESPISPLIALGTLLGLAAAFLWVLRRRKSALNRAKVS